MSVKTSQARRDLESVGAFRVINFGRVRENEPIFWEETLMKFVSSLSRRDALKAGAVDHDRTVMSRILRTGFPERSRQR